jgi:hypothetical protein
MGDERFLKRHSQEYITRNKEMVISYTTQSGIHNQEWRVRDYGFYTAGNEVLEVEQAMMSIMKSMAVSQLGWLKVIFNRGEYGV